MMTYFIITGTSRGLGEGLAYQLLTQDNVLFCISRTKNQQLVERARQRSVRVKYFSWDLQDVDSLDALMNTNIMPEIDSSQATALYLINNAALLEPVKPAGKYTAGEINAHVQVNLAAPMMLSSLFIRATQSFSGEKYIINISSGAAQHPHFGWGTYCSTKAALNMFTQCMGIEQKEQPSPVTVVAVDPGIVDTSMQQRIRQTSEADFPDVQRFINYHQQGQLTSPETAARKILDFLEKNTLQQGRFYHL